MGHYNEQSADFSHGQFQLLKLPGHGTADQMSMTPDKVIRLQHVTYTSCPKQHNDWLINARDSRSTPMRDAASATARP